MRGKRGEHVVDFECNGIIVSRDIKIEFFHKNLKVLLLYTATIRLSATSLDCAIAYAPFLIPRVLNLIQQGLMLFFWFHTSYINNNYLCLRKRDLERAGKDKQCKHFAAGFKVCTLSRCLSLSLVLSLVLSQSESVSAILDSTIKFSLMMRNVLA
jgi:hypothetical protein